MRSSIRVSFSSTWLCIVVVVVFFFFFFAICFKMITDWFVIVDSNLQTFPPSGTQGKISGGSQPPRDADGI